MSETKNLGLVKAIFKQSATPVRTDIIWYDTSSSLLKYYDTIALKWMPLKRPQLSGSLTDDNPLRTEISAIVGLTPSEAGVGYQASIRDTTGSEELYLVESDGTNWCYVKMAKSLTL